MRRLLPSRRARPGLWRSAWRAIPLALAALVSLTLASSVLAATYNLTITAPATKATGLGSDVTVMVDTGGLTLVPGPQATGPNDLHIHYMLDVDVAPYLDGKVAVPTGNPSIVHSAETSHTFTGLAPGAHTVTVLLTDSTHHAIQPPVHPSVTFTVGSAASGSSGDGDNASASSGGSSPTSLPKSGGVPIEVVDLFAAIGAILALVGLTVRRRALRLIPREALSRITTHTHSHPTRTHPASVEGPDPRSRGF